jgi:diphosphomevalonate decarboxylase
MDGVRGLRARGTAAFFTIDAGPHVKVLVEPESARSVSESLAAVPGVLRVIESGAGPDAALVAEKKAGKTE